MAQEYWAVNGRTGIAGRVTEAGAAELRKESPGQWAFYNYNGQDSGISQTAGGYTIDPSVAARRQALLDYYQGLDRATNQYGAETGRFNAQTQRMEAGNSFQNAATGRLNALTQLGSTLNDVTGPKDYFQFANNMRGQPDGSALSFLSSLSGHASDMGVAPMDQSAMSARTMNESDLAKAAGNVSAWSNSGDPAKDAASLAAAQNQGGGAAASGAPASGGGGKSKWSLNQNADGTYYWKDDQGNFVSTARTDKPTTTPDGYPVDGLASTPAAAAAASYPNQGVSAEVQGASMHKDSGQSAWEARRDALLGGQRHDDFQMAHSTTAQELNDVAKIGDPEKRKAAFRALQQRGSWTPETSHGSNWRPAGDRSGSGYKHDNTFNYNAAPTMTYQTPQERGPNRTYSTRGDNATNTGQNAGSQNAGTTSSYGTRSLTRDQQHKLDQKASRNRAKGGANVYLAEGGGAVANQGQDEFRVSPLLPKRSYGPEEYNPSMGGLAGGESVYGVAPPQGRVPKDQLAYVGTPADPSKGMPRYAPEKAAVPKNLPKKRAAAPAGASAWTATGDGSGAVTEPGWTMDSLNFHSAARWWAAQHGGSIDDAKTALMLPENKDYLESAMGMARAGEIDAILGKETPNSILPPANVAATRDKNWQQAYMEQQARGAQNNADANKPRTIKVKAHTRTVSAPYDRSPTRDKNWQTNYQEQQARGARNLATGDFAGAVSGGVNGGLALAPGRVTHAARGGSVQVVNHPETVHVGEHSKPEAVFVYPLARGDTKVPPAVMALSQALERGRSEGHMAMGGGMASMPGDPMGNAPMGTGITDMNASMPPDAQGSMQDNQEPGSFDPTDPNQPPESLAVIQAVLSSPDRGNSPPLVLAIRQNWALQGGKPVYIGQKAGNASQIDGAGQQTPSAHDQVVQGLARGGGITYGAISPGAAVNSVASKPNSAGQMSVPWKGKTKMVPAGEAMPYPEATRAQPRFVRNLGPTDQNLLSSYLQTKGDTLPDWLWRQQQGLPKLARVPNALGMGSGAF